VELPNYSEITCPGYYLTVPKFYIASDGLYDQPSPNCGGQFGYKRFGKIILNNHNEPQSVITERVWEAFEAHRGEVARVDDFQLITFKL